MRRRISTAVGLLLAALLVAACDTPVDNRRDPGAVADDDRGSNRDTDGSVARRSS